MKKLVSILTALVLAITVMTGSVTASAGSSAQSSPALTFSDGVLSWQVSETVFIKVNGRYYARDENDHYIYMTEGYINEDGDIVPDQVTFTGSSVDISGVINEMSKLNQSFTFAVYYAANSVCLGTYTYYVAATTNPSTSTPSGTPPEFVDQTCVGDIIGIPFSQEMLDKVLGVGNASLISTTSFKLLNDIKREKTLVLVGYNNAGGYGSTAALPTVDLGGHNVSGAWDSAEECGTSVVATVGAITIQNGSVTASGAPVGIEAGYDIPARWTTAGNVTYGNGILGWTGTSNVAIEASYNGYSRGYIASNGVYGYISSVRTAISGNSINIGNILKSGMPINLPVMFTVRDYTTNTVVGTLTYIASNTKQTSSGGGLTLSKISESTYRITWNAVATAAGYDINVITTGIVGNNYHTVNTYYDLDCPLGTTARITVYANGVIIGTAYIAADGTASSNGSTGSAPNYGYGITVAKLSTSGYRITWNPIAGAASYAVSIVINGVAQNYSTTNTYYDLDCPSGIPVQITVYACDSSGTRTSTVGAANISATGTVTNNSNTSTGTSTGTTSGITVQGQNCYMVVGASSTTVYINVAVSGVYTCIYAIDGVSRQIPNITGSVFSIPVGADTSFTMFCAGSSGSTGIVASATYSASAGGTSQMQMNRGILNLNNVTVNADADAVRINQNYRSTYPIAGLPSVSISNGNLTSKNRYALNVVANDSAIVSEGVFKTVSGDTPVNICGLSGENSLTSFVAAEYVGEFSDGGKTLTVTLLPHGLGGYVIDKESAEAAFGADNIDVTYADGVYNITFKSDIIMNSAVNFVAGNWNIDFAGHKLSGGLYNNATSLGISIGEDVEAVLMNGKIQGPNQTITSRIPITVSGKAVLKDMEVMTDIYSACNTTVMLSNRGEVIIDGGTYGSLMGSYAVDASAPLCKLTILNGTFNGLVSPVRYFRGGVANVTSDSIPRFRLGCHVTVESEVKLSEEDKTLTVIHVHGYADEWLYDGTNHWKECTCGEKSEIAVHTWNGGEADEQLGYTVYNCTVCDAVKYEKITGEHKHSFGTDWVADAYNHWKECSCGATSEKAAHDWDNGTVDANAGLVIFKCKICGSTKTVAKEEEHVHSFGANWVADTYNHWKECSCGATSEKAAHDWDNGTVDTNAGLVIFKCKICGSTKTVAKEEEHVHSFGANWVADAYNHWKECSCGETSEKSVHTWDSGTLDEASGVMIYKCTVCGAAKSESQKEEHEHSFGTDWVADGFNHWKECSCGETSEKSAHVWDKGTPDESAGMIIYKCTVCGAVKSEKTSVEHVHSFGTTWCADTFNHWKECICGTTSEKAFHSWDNGRVSYSGIITYRCTVCGFENSIAMSGAAYVPSYTPAVQSHSHAAGRWEHSELTHWKFCLDCGASMYYGEHNFVNGVCADCGYAEPNDENFVDVENPQEIRRICEEEQEISE